MAAPRFAAYAGGMTDSATAGGAALETRISEDNISLMVDRFYDGVQVHPTLGPVFNPRLEGRWDRHLSQMKAFWSSVLLQSGRYDGYPLGAHFGVPGMEREHFADWLDLFRQTLDGIYEERVADFIHEAAQRMAGRFSYALFTLIPQQQAAQGKQGE